MIKNNWRDIKDATLRLFDALADLFLAIYPWLILAFVIAVFYVEGNILW